MNCKRCNNKLNQEKTDPDKGMEIVKKVECREEPSIDEILKRYRESEKRSKELYLENLGITIDLQEIWTSGMTDEQKKKAFVRAAVKKIREGLTG